MSINENTTAQLPDLFVVFPKEVPYTNPNYAIVRAESDSKAWR